MTEIFNLHTLCRCCHSDGSFKSLQLSYAYDNRIEVYSTMLKETLDVTINPPPFEASYTICDSCIGKLRDAACFKQQVLWCEERFAEYCKNEQGLTIKMEIDYDCNNDVNSARDEENEEVYCDDVKHETRDVKVVEIKIEADDNDDEDLPVKIKYEESEAVSLNTQETIPIEYVGEDQEKVLSSEKSHSANAAVRRRKQGIYDLDLELECRVKTEHGYMFKCKTCNKNYKFLKHLRNHILKQHKDAYKCQFCSLQCDGRLHYLKHSKSHISELFKCPFCEKSFRKRKSITQHIKTHTNTRKFQCDICHKFFAHKQTLIRHLLVHYGNKKPCMCDMCGHVFNDKTNLYNHIRAVHENRRPFECNLCPKTFKTKKHWKLHSFYHSGEKHYKCDMCMDEFISPWMLRNHKFKVHPTSSTADEVRKLYTCKICKLELDTRSKYRSHLKCHGARKEYKCQLCLKDFSSKFSLKRHISEHSGLREVCCDICDKKYTQRSQLLRHKKRIHDPTSKIYFGRFTEPGKCELCNKSYKDIKKHMEAHKTRPHTCEICLKSYPERNTLNRHISIVHRGVRHPCTLCDKKYTNWSGLQKHTMKVHMLELKKEIEES